MSSRLHSAQTVTSPRARLNPGGGSGEPFATVDLTDLTYLAIDTSAEAYALRDAFQRAGDLLSEVEGGAS